MPLLVIPVGLVIGTALGALGGGGSVLTVPALVYLFGLDPRQATTASLVVVGTTSLVALYPHARRKHVRFLQGSVFGLLGIAGSLTGAAASTAVPPTLLLVAFAGLMAVVAVVMWRHGHAATGDRATRVGGERPMVSIRPFVCDCSRVITLTVTATGVGLLTGFLGVGGGFVVVPALVLLLGYPMPEAVGTSVLIIAINSGTALIGRTANDVHLDWPVIGGLTAVAVVGSLVGARLAATSSPRRLTRALAVVLGLVAAYIGARTLWGT
jgi:uncharacterized membrane protein YfcA